jgi:hypothetical protein
VAADTSSTGNPRHPRRIPDRRSSTAECQRGSFALPRNGRLSCKTLTQGLTQECFGLKSQCLLGTKTLHLPFAGLFVTRQEGFELPTFGSVVGQGMASLACLSHFRAQNMSRDDLRFAEFGTWFGTCFPGEPTLRLPARAQSQPEASSWARLLGYSKAAQMSANA